VSRLRGVFSESRKILPHSIERQLGPETLPSTAPEDGRLRGGSLLCLHQAPDHGLGGVPRALKIVLRSSEKTPLNRPRRLKKVTTTVGYI
jgi:hypothetical protein